MPVALMAGGRDADLYAHYAAAAQQTSVYTASDHRGILEHLIRQWRLLKKKSALRVFCCMH
jgi:acyl-[acyl-carrier-protein] desaturase